MPVYKVSFPRSLLDRKYVTGSDPLPKYGLNTTNDLHIWEVLNEEVTEWVEANIRVKSAMKIRMQLIRENAVPGNVNGLTVFAHFGTEEDAVLFKMRWG